MILYLDDDEDELIKKLMTKHKIKSKHKAVKLMIDSFKDKVD